MGIPGAERAVADIAKLRDCCLNSLHLRGRHKARVFAERLGLSAADAATLVRKRYAAADALHVASAERVDADVLLTCDDRLCRIGRRWRKELSVRIAEPVAWLREVSNAPNAG